MLESGRQAHHDSVGDEDAESGMSSERGALAGSVASGDEADEDGSGAQVLQRWTKCLRIEGH